MTSRVVRTLFASSFGFASWSKLTPTVSSSASLPDNPWRTISRCPSGPPSRPPTISPQVAAAAPIADAPERRIARR